MADFRPETTVYLFRATAVDGENQPYFSSEGAKMGWYNSHSPRAYTQYSYQRENREYIRVDDKAENLRAYDMMGFRNSSGKWVLCRIESVEFINPNCTEITYSVDYMQTYIENITFGKCWVEREMQTNDWYGSDPSFNNLQPEGIETGVLTRTEINTVPYEYTDFTLIVFSAYDRNGEANYDVVSDENYPTGLNAIKFDIPYNGDMPQLSFMLQQYTQKGIDLSTAIAGMLVVPKQYASGSLYRNQMEVQKPWPTLFNYRPVNSKCFSGEFCRLEISNRRGNEQELRPEILMDGTSVIQLNLEGALGGGAGGTILYPANYGGHLKDFGVIRYDDIQAPFVGNAFASWLSGNAAQMVASIALPAVAAVANPALGASMAVGGLANAMNTIGRIVDKSKDPASIGGQTAGNVMDLVLGNYGFSVNWLHPTVENLQSIDEFFGRFGYRTNRFKVPNVNTRPKWNYVKTSDAVCRGPFSKTAQEYMQNLMNKGVTFWHLGGGEEITDDWTIEQNKE